MIKYKNNINVGTGSVGYEADATSAAPADSVSGGRIVKSEGRTVKWNQLVQNGNFANTSKWNREGSTVFTVSDNIAHITKDSGNHGLAQSLESISGHKYFVSFTGYCESDTTISLTFSVASNVVLIGAISAGKWGHYSDIKTCSTGKTVCYLYEAGQTPHEILVKNAQAFDLTDIFGAGNEPTTVEAFEEWMSENIVEQDYYDYDAGSLVPVVVKGVKRDVGGTTVTNPMPVTTLKDENDVVMFPDGLKSAGSVKDEIDWEHGVAVKRVGVVDMGDLTWTAESTANVYSFGRTAYGITRYSTVVCAKYPYVGLMGASQMDDKTMGGGASGLYVMIKDSSYSTAADFKTAIQGVLLYYELATPITYHFATHADLKKRVVKIGESVEVDGIEGETVVWNQKVNTSFPVVYSYDNTQGTAARYVHLFYFYHNIPSGETHKLIFWYDITVGDNQTLTDTGTDFIYLYQNESGDTRVTFNSSFGRGRKIIKKYVTYTPNSQTLETQKLYSATFIGHIADFTINSLSVIDLTLMFGAGNEPATVAEFESWLSAHGGIKDYYPYCAGELKDKEEGNVRGVTQNPYKSITRSVDLTTLKGKVDGAGEDVVMFPDGMKQAGSVKDEIFVEGGVVKAVKRVGSVDLGVLDWTENQTVSGRKTSNEITTMKKVASTTVVNSIICGKYQTVSYQNQQDNLLDKTVSSAQSGAYNKIFILDTAYTDASDFTTAMQGVMLNYELASPVTYVVNMQGMEIAEVKKVMVGMNLIYEK